MGEAEVLEENIDPAMRRAGWCGLMHPGGHTCMKDVGHAPPHEDDMSGGIWEDEPYQDTADEPEVPVQTAVESEAPSALLEAPVAELEQPGDADPAPEEQVFRELDARFGSAPDPEPIQTPVDSEEPASDGETTSEDASFHASTVPTEDQPAAVGEGDKPTYADCPTALGKVCVDPTCPLHFGGGAAVSTKEDQPAGELEATAEQVHQAEVVARPIPVAQFEGEFARVMTGKLPAITLDMPEGYARGTHLKLEVEVRVRRVAYDDVRSGEHKGELLREHIFALEEVKLIGAYHPDELDPGIGGGLGQLEA